MLISQRKRRKPASYREGVYQGRVRVAKAKYGDLRKRKSKK